MRVKTYKKTNKFYENIYTRERKTKEIEVIFDNGCIVRFAEHQLGQKLDIPQVDIIYEKGCYGMDIQTFLKQITS